MIIGITGTNGAGKGAVVDYLVSQKGFIHYSVGDYLATILIERGLERDRSNLRAVGNELREKFGPGYLVERFSKEALEKGESNIVIESIRSTGEALKLKEVGGALIVVDAERALRYERIHTRGSGKDHIDFDTFVEQEEREWYGALGKNDMNIKAVIDMADYTILNNGTLPDLYREIEKVITV